MAATTQPLNWSCATATEGERVLITPQGELDLATARHLRDAIGNAIASRKDVVVDLAGLTYIDSSGLHCLLLAATAARDSGVGLELLPGEPPVMRLFELTGTLDALPFGRTS